MNWMNQIGGLLQQYAGAEPATTSRQPEEVQQHFEQAASAAPQGVLSEALANAFRSNATPAFPDIVSNLFHNSNNQQRAGLLNSLLSGLGPGALGSILTGGGMAQLGGLLGGGGRGSIAPEQAQQVSPEAVKELAQRAEQSNPSIVDRVSEFYAQHPTLVKALGAAAMWEVLRHMANRTRS
jgi:hypothetical protein